MHSSPFLLRVAAALLLAAAAGCSAPRAARPAPAGAETVYAVTARLELVRFDAADPATIVERRRLLGLAPGEGIAGLDFRMSRGVLYALSTTGRLFTVDTATGILARVGTAPAIVPLEGGAHGFDFNPAADRIRVVGAGGQNLRLHPDTGAVVDGDTERTGLQPDTPLAYAPGDPHQGRAPQVVAAAYTYHKADDTRTTLYGIDRALGLLVRQGSAAGEPATVSPDTGRLFTVGALGLGPLADASFDIADTDNAALAVVRSADGPATRLVRIDLATGRARAVGTVGDGEALLGMAVAP